MGRLQYFAALSRRRPGAAERLAASKSCSALTSQSRVSLASRSSASIRLTASTGPGLRLRIVAAADGGLPRSEVARVFGVGSATLTRYLRRPRHGPPPIKTAALQAALSPRLPARPDATLAEHCAWWEQAAGSRGSRPGRTRPAGPRGSRSPSSGRCSGRSVRASRPGSGVRRPPGRRPPARSTRPAAVRTAGRSERVSGHTGPGPPEPRRAVAHPLSAITGNARPVCGVAASSARRGTGRPAGRSPGPRAARPPARHRPATCPPRRRPRDSRPAG